MHVIIIGGGTAGLAIAQGLHNHRLNTGADITVSCFERDVATGPEQGYRIAINEDGCEALKSCLPAHIYESFEKLTEGGYKLAIVNEQLQLLDDPIEQLSHRPVDRYFFRDILKYKLEGILHIGKKFDHYEERGDKVVAFFDDGSQFEGDLLIGADGANSKVRAQLLPHVERVRTGVVSLACKIRYDPELLPFLQGCLVKCPNNRGMFVAPYQAPTQPSPFSHSPLNHTGSYILFGISCHEDNFINKDVHWSELSQEQLRDECLNRVKDCHPKLQHIVENGSTGVYTCIDLKTSVRVGIWETKRITLVGDAIHSMTPFRGTGANTALRDAAVLVQAIKDSVSRPEEVPILQAIATYEKEMIERGFGMMEKSLKICLWVHNLG